MNKISLIITLSVIIIGSVLYFTFAEQMVSPAMLENLRFKTNYLDGNLKIFAQARNNDLAMMRAEGNPLPEYGSMVIGSDEAAMMIEESLIAGPGSSLIGFFGTNIKVEGILRNTGTVVDDMHFFGQDDFAKVQGEEGKIRIIMEEGMPKAFYRYDVSEPLKVPLAEGNIVDYKPTTINGKKYYPVIIGSEEAKMMRELKLFSKVGERIEGFFGTDAIIVGVMNKTGTSLDMMHLVMAGGGI